VRAAAAAVGRRRWWWGRTELGARGGGREEVRRARGRAGTEASARREAACGRRAGIARREVRDGPDTWGPPARERERGRGSDGLLGLLGWVFFSLTNFF